MFNACGVCGKPFPDELSLRTHLRRLDADGEPHDGEPWCTVTPVVTAQWEDDCQGKQDFDGRILGIATRYWPGIRETMRIERTHLHTTVGEVVGSSLGHAHAALVLWNGNVGGDSVTVCDEHFRGETFEAVKPQVEAWAQAVTTRAWRAIIREFAADEPQHGWGAQDHD